MVQFFMRILDYNHEEIQGHEREQELRELVALVKETCLKSCPEEWREVVNKTYEDLNIIIFDIQSGRKYNRILNGEKTEETCNAGALYGIDEYVEDESGFTYKHMIAIHPKASKHQIVHELFHAFSTKHIRDGEVDKSKVGAKHTTYDYKNDKDIESYGQILNEGMTEAITQQLLSGHIQDTSGYGDEVLMAHLLQGQGIENNAFVYDVYFGDGKAFGQKFDQTISDKNVNFAIYKNVQFDLENQEHLPLFKSAIECTLKRVKTAEGLKQQTDYLQDCFNKYNGGFYPFRTDEHEKHITGLLEYVTQISNERMSESEAQLGEQGCQNEKKVQGGCPPNCPNQCCNRV